MALTRADTQVRSAARQTVYSDVVDSFTMTPFNGDVGLVTNARAVSQAIKNICLTNLGERPFEPNIGSSIPAALFSQDDPATFTAIEANLYLALKSFEPRAVITDISVTAMPDQDALNISVTFYIINTTESTTTNIILKRVR